MSQTVSLLATRVADLLRSTPCQKVDFWLGGLHVSGAGFTAIAHLISNAGTTGQGVTVAVGDITQNAEASYDQTTNTILVPNLDYAKTDAFQRVAVVHEAVHALRDSHGAVLSYRGRPYRPRAATDEAAAYLAGCLFDVFEQREKGEVSPSPAWLAARKAPIHAVAYGVALKQAARPAGSAVERSDLSILVTSIRTSMRALSIELPRYYDFDGVPR